MSSELDPRSSPRFATTRWSVVLAAADSDAGVARDALARFVVSQVCAALQFAHEHDVVHRDIKPENILIDREGRVKIADFGLAKVARDASLEAGGAPVRLTRTRQAMGTPQYMAPEQIEHPLEVDHRADIYSLGVVFYELLTGELPLGRFAPPSQKVGVDVRVDHVVLRSLEKEPERRYQHASEVRTRLEDIQRNPGKARCTMTTSGTADRGHGEGERHGGRLRGARFWIVLALMLFGIFVVGSLGCIALGAVFLAGARIEPASPEASPPFEAPAGEPSTHSLGTSYEERARQAIDSALEEPERPTAEASTER